MERLLTFSWQLSGNSKPRTISLWGRERLRLNTLNSFET